MENSSRLYRNYRLLSTSKTDLKMFCFFNTSRLQWNEKTGKECIKTKPKATALARQTFEVIVPEGTVWINERDPLTRK